MYGSGRAEQRGLTVDNRSSIDLIIRQRIDAEIERIRNLNDHDKLGVNRGARQPEIVRAFVNRQRDLDPALFSRYEPQTHAVAKTLYGMICEAAARLGVTGAVAPEREPEPEPPPPAQAPAAAAAAPPPPAQPHQAPPPARQAPPPAPRAPAPPPAPMAHHVHAGPAPTQTGAPGLPPLPQLYPAHGQWGQPTGYTETPNEAAWRHRAEVAEHRLTELQYHGFQLLEQMKEAARRGDAAEMLVRQLKVQLARTEAVNTDLAGRLNAVNGQMQQVQARLTSTEREKPSTKDGWIREQVGQVASMLRADAARAPSNVERHHIHLQALEDLAKGRTQQAAESFRELARLAPESQAYRAGLELAERTSLEGGGFDDETTSGFRAALAMAGKSAPDA